MTLNTPSHFITEQNVWAQIISNITSTIGRPALFLDRDGVIVEEVNYLHRPEDVLLIPGTIETIRCANEKNIPVIIVTNQAGIGRRKYDWYNFADVQDKIFELLIVNNVNIDAVFACPHHIEAHAPYFHKNHPWRKPNPGMLEAANKLMKINLSKSWIVGDKSSDLEAGLNAGCAGGAHVRTGYGQENKERNKSLSLKDEHFKIKLLPSIAEISEELPIFKRNNSEKSH